MFKKFVIAYDHRVDKKTIERVKQALTEEGIEVDVFEDNGEANDYPIMASRAYEMFKKNAADGLLLMCGTGIGMNIVANKFDGIRSVLATSEAEAYFARRHEDANSLVFGVGYGDGVFEVKLCRRKMVRMIKTFVSTAFEGDRHVRRVEQIAKIEKGGRL